MELTLRPCPACDALPEIRPWRGNGPRRVMVACGNVDCPAVLCVIQRTRRDAITAWNRRARRRPPTSGE